MAAPNQKHKKTITSTQTHKAPLTRAVHKNTDLCGLGQHSRDHKRWEDPQNAKLVCRDKWQEGSSGLWKHTLVLHRGQRLSLGWGESRPSVSSVRLSRTGWLAMRACWTALFSLGQRLSDPLSLIKSCHSSVEFSSRWYPGTKSFSQKPICIADTWCLCSASFPMKITQCTITATTISHYCHNKQPSLTKQTLLTQQPLLTQQTPIIDATKQPLLTQQTPIIDTTKQPLLTQQTPIIDTTKQPLLTQQTPIIDTTKQPLLTQQTPIIDATKQPLLTQQTPIIDATKQPLLTQQTPIIDTTNNDYITNSRDRKGYWLNV